MRSQVGRSVKQNTWGLQKDRGENTTHWHLTTICRRHTRPGIRRWLVPGDELGLALLPNGLGPRVPFLFYAKFVVALGSTTTHHELEEADC